MKYFAILKDSLRKALDSKVLIVLLILSTLVMAGVALFSFKPLSAEKTFAMFFSNGFEPALIPFTLNIFKQEKMLEGDLFQPGGPRIKMPRGFYTLKDVTCVRGEPDDPESDYRLLVTQSNWRHGDPQPANIAEPDAPIEALREAFKDAVDLGFIKVDIEYADHQEGEGPQAIRRHREGHAQNAPHLGDGGTNLRLCVPWVGQAAWRRHQRPCSARPQHWLVGRGAVGSGDHLLLHPEHVAQGHRGPALGEADSSLGAA